MSVLKVDSLDIGYEGKTVAANIDFEVKKGEYLCIVGENGAGKSTLVKTLLGLIKPIKGTVEVGSGGIGYLPQQTDIQRDFPATVKEIVLSGCISGMGIRPFYSSVEKKKAKKNMELMSVWNMRNKSYRKLSGGQQQRVLLARALCASQDMLFLDEPVTGLDPKVTQDFYELVEKINSEGVTIIMVSHDMEAALKYSSHILHIDKDSIFYGTKDEYLKSDEAVKIRAVSKKEDE